MRWFVEISSLGAKAGPSTTLCVEASQWQPALQKARSLRGDDGPLSNFSIELLEDGFRAIDPMTRMRYLVKRAPDDAAITNGEAAPAPAPASAAAPAPAATAAPAKRAPMQTVVFASMGAAVVADEKAAAEKAAAEKAAAEKAAAEKAAAEKAAAEKAAAAADPEPVRRRAAAKTMAFSSSGAATVREEVARVRPPIPPDPVPPAPAPVAPKITAPSAPKITAPAVSAPAPAAPALPAYTLVSQREENPSERSPLSYREHVYAVAPGTSEDDAQRLMLDRFEHVRASLEQARAGKLINLAIFDHVFQQKPLRRPLVTLAWKDWKSEVPEILFPARMGSAEAPPRSASSPGPAPTSMSAPLPVPPAPPAPAAPAGAVSPGPTLASQAASTPAPIVPSPVVVIASPQASAPAPAKVASAPAPVPASPTPAPDSPAAAPPTAPVATKPSPQVAPAPQADRASAPVPERASAPVPERVSAPAPVAPAPVAPAPAQRTPVQAAAPARAVPKKRLSGDDLLSELFEAFSDLHFLRDAYEGAEFVLAATLEKLPSEVGLVSLFDINKREFVIVRQAGGPRFALGQRQPERAPIAGTAMRKRHAVVVAEADGARRASDDRWKAIGVEIQSLVCAPVELGGRYLGLIELANPLDGGVFNEGDGNALTYIGQQFAEFVASRGVIIDAEQIQAGAAPKPSVPPPAKNAPIAQTAKSAQAKKR
jgi:GAF domain